MMSETFVSLFPITLVLRVTYEIDWQQIQDKPKEGLVHLTQCQKMK